MDLCDLQWRLNLQEDIISSCGLLPPFARLTPPDGNKPIQWS